MLRRLLLALFITLVLVTAQRLARADAVCASADKTYDAWRDLVEPLDKKIERIGAFKIPPEMATRTRAGIARLSSKTMALAKELYADRDPRYKRFGLYLPFHLKMLSEIDHAAGDDWDDTSDAIWNVAGDLWRVYKLCEADRR